MWVPPALLELFSIGKETVSILREEVATLKVERDALKDHLKSVSINSDWFRMKVNQLEVEKAALIEKAYGVKLPAPEFVRTLPQADYSLANKVLDSDLFNDMGDELAKRVGLPTYNDPNRA